MTPLKSWLRYLRVERGLAASTIAAYERELRSVSTHVAPTTLASVTVQDLRSWLHEAGGSAATVSRRVAALRSCFGWLVRTGQREDDPSRLIDRPKVHRGLPRPVSDLEAVLAGASVREQALILFLVETGLRISEACALSCALPAPYECIVLGKGHKERVVPLTDLARVALEELGGAVGWSARTVQRRLHALGITPHRLRHTFATDLACRDVDLSVIQDLLGHASPATTRVYQRNDIRRLREGIERR